MTAIIILIAAFSFLAGAASGAILFASSRARLETHIAAQREMLREAHHRLLQFHRVYGGQEILLQKIEKTVTTILEEETH